MIHSHDMADTITLHSDDSAIETWICHLVLSLFSLSLLDPSQLTHTV